jgi:hypothetical protein
MREFNTNELANIFWSFAKWSVAPPLPWLEAYWQSLFQRATELQPPGLCSVLWGCAVLEIKPPPELLDALLLEAQVGMDEARARAGRCWGSCWRLFFFC